MIEVPPARRTRRTRASQAPSACPGGPPQSCPIRSSAARKWNVAGLVSGAREGMWTPWAASSLTLRPSRSCRYVVPVLGAPLCTYTLRLIPGILSAGERPYDGGGAGTTEASGQPGGRLDEHGQVDPVLDPQAGEEPDEVLRRQVAGGALGVGAAAEAAGAGVERRDADAQGGERVREGLAVGVVEVHREVLCAQPRLGERLHQRGHVT